MGVGVVTPFALKQSPHRNQLKVLNTPDFNPAVRAWVVHRPPAGRLARPIKAFSDALDRELQALIRG
jgi:DNA-binding transcriptional LysR family regulator